MNTEEFPEDSESSDEDYNPGGPTEAVSEVDSDGDPEDPLSDSEEVTKRGTTKRKKATKKKNSNKKANLNDKEVKEEEAEKPKVSEEEQKKHADSLWDMFKKDTGFKLPAKEKSAENTGEKDKPVPTVSTTSKPSNNKVKITQIFEFAGEEVKVDKEVAAESAEARLFSANAAPTASNGKPPVGAKTKGGLGGIGSVLSQLGKKQKLSTLEKTKLDWDRFKKDEDIEEELQAHTKGKDSYLDKQDFLQRADLRRFEIEKEVRTVERNKRLNNLP